jgi:hypothetical protein
MNNGLVGSGRTAKAALDVPEI